MTDKPFILDVIRFFLTNNVPIFIQDIFHLPVQMGNLTTVQREIPACRPCKIFLSYDIRIKGYFKTFILDFTQIGRNAVKTGNFRQSAVHQQIVSLCDIKFHGTTQYIIKQRIIQPYIIRRCPFPFKSNIRHTVYIQLRRIIKITILIDVRMQTGSQIGKCLILTYVSITILPPRKSQFTVIQP